MFGVLALPVGRPLEAQDGKQDDFRWLHGANYVASYAATDVEMWLRYDHALIDRELGYARKMRRNCVRVFLQSLVYHHHPQTFLARFEDFLATADKHGLKVMPILFDSCFGVAPSLESRHIWVANPGPDRTGLAPTPRPCGIGRSHGVPSEDALMPHWDGRARRDRIGCRRADPCSVRFLVCSSKCQYVVTVSRRPRYCEFYPVTLRERLPRVGIPLAAGDPDVTLDLQAVFARCWQTGPYPALLRYDQPPPGELSEDDVAWCRQQLVAAGWTNFG